ncbi:MAG: protein kinase [Chloroflexi bacterium GWB2_49_20]|nr:MAG: protein kinase [Chloroflexi bacterium GWB2_49_20]OGN76094.1 MAG: protein kinase [Chloroflexi bacterium GWC2_49_37]OGN83480.1 MAG: protein kinase [Chloroflexi bacterium GWD2_49_16]HBG73880.1 serine/threonine protein kinase [Anaerolineae bacterium]HCC79541.1 serine/threonine protein kinase [Anaerolineae bacterium]
MPLGLKLGEVLRNRYKIRERIGQGGMGNIYLADDLRLEGRQCALKEVEYDRNTPENLLKEAREQFLREATVLARLDHPNLPKVSDFFSINQRDYLVMDFVPGNDLRMIMQEARQQNTFLEENTVLNWASQLMDALAYLHKQIPPLVHRDIKPSNLKITPDGLLKLVDFGLVKILAPDEVTVTIIQGRGTALYTPLEQYGDDGRHTDARSDVYSLGATLYHLLTNQPPADARQRFLNPASLIQPRKINAIISIKTEKTILWAMSLHPDERPASIEIMKDSLFYGREIPVRTLGQTQKPRESIQKILSRKPDNALVWISGFLFLTSLIVTLLR